MTFLAVSTQCLGNLSQLSSDSSYTRAGKRCMEVGARAGSRSMLRLREVTAEGGVAPQSSLLQPELTTVMGLFSLKLTTPQSPSLLWHGVSYRLKIYTTHYDRMKTIMKRRKATKSGPFAGSAI